MFKTIRACIIRASERKFIHVAYKIVAIFDGKIFLADPMVNAGKPLVHPAGAGVM